MRYVTDPRTGIAANPLADPETGRVWSGMPDAANVKRACEIHFLPTRKLMERETALRIQFAERDQLAIEHKRQRPSYEELQRRCQEVGLMIGPKGSRLAPVDVAEFRIQHGISKEQWDAIPNAKAG